MKSRWSDAEAAELVDRLAENGVADDLALRVYTTRLLGQDPKLVLHGGGNTSLKTYATDVAGERHQMLHVKGSGWDMAHIETEGLPAVKLDPLLKLRRLSRLGDEEMVNYERANLLDSNAPTPSIETLLHAFMPFKFVDHTHSNAVLSLTNQINGEDLCREVFGGRVGIVEYIKPGFDLAQDAAAVFESDPDVEGADTAEARRVHVCRLGPPSIREDDRDRSGGRGETEGGPKDRFRRRVPAQCRTRRPGRAHSPRRVYAQRRDRLRRSFAIRPGVPDGPTDTELRQR